MSANPGPASALSILPAGSAGVRLTLLKMRGLVRKGKLEPKIRRLALLITQPLPQKDYSGQVRLMQQFVRDYIRYVGDIHGVETLQTPELTLRLRAGDCDDKSVLVATLLETINHPTQFVAVGTEPDVYSHVYVETLLGGRWFTVETTEPVEAGWEPTHTVSRMVVQN